MVSEALGAQLGYLAVLIGYLSLPVVMVVAAFGGFLSDQFLFFLGRRYGNRVLARFPSMAARAPRVHELVKRWDILAVTLVRFLYGLRIAGPVVIGTCGIALWRLVLFNLVGALVWACVVAGVGYFAGQALQQWFGRLEHTHVLLLMAAVLAVMIVSILSAWRRRRLRRSPTR